MNGRVVWGLLFGLRALFFVSVFHESLTPDTAEYSSGGACWSSLVACAAGRFGGGFSGVAAVGVVGAFLLGWVVGGGAGALWAFLLPPGWYSIQAGADAGGAAFVGWLGIRRLRGASFRSVLYVVFASSFHLVAGLELVWARFLGKGLGYRFWPLWVFSGGAVACLGEWHLQVRYFLPGVAVLALSWNARRRVRLLGVV